MGRQNGTIFTIAILIISALLALHHLMQSSMHAVNILPPIVIIAIIAILCAAQIAALYAIARKTYRKALPLCSLDSLIVAVIFMLSAILG